MSGPRKSGDVEMTFDEQFFVRLGRDPGVVAECDSVGNTIASAARSNAPVKSGDYQASIKTRHGERQGRHATEVVSDDPAALAIEARFGTLARAVVQAKKAR